MTIRDCCQDKTSPYDIRPEDKPLIDAAINLGEWLSNQAITSDEEKSAIQKMLTFLNNLPSPPPEGLNAEFGFFFESINPNAVSHGGTWSVSVCRGMFEMYSVPVDEDDEFSWLLCPGIENQNSLYNSDTWIRQISNPNALAVDKHKLTLEASVSLSLSAAIAAYPASKSDT